MIEFQIEGEDKLFNCNNKSLSFRIGISLAGVGLGTFLTVPVVTSLSEEFGWRKLMMIFAGYVLICGLFGILFRPINLSTEEHRSPEHLDAG